MAKMSPAARKMVELFKSRWPNAPESTKDEIRRDSAFAIPMFVARGELSEEEATELLTFIGVIKAPETPAVLH